MINLFIDSNIYLSFYRLNKDDLEELRKLSVAINNNQIKLYTTPQLKNEFRRNREKVVSESLKLLKERGSLPDTFPQIIRNYEEFELLKRARREYSEHNASLLAQAERDIKAGTLEADTLINKLFEVSMVIDMDEAIVDKAKRRFDLGNPPGKNRSYGDAINWETLLAGHPNEDLCFITDDGDFKSLVNKDQLCEYLHLEWQDKKTSNVKLYENLSSFFREKYPSIKLANQLEIELCITSLLQSPGFLSTHKAIARLARIAEFSESQIRAIYEAAITNDQIYWISEDQDVATFMDRVVRKNSTLFTEQELKVFEEKYTKEEPNNEEIDLDDMPW